MTFKTIGILPNARGRWHVRTGGGHVVFVNEDPDVTPYALLDAGLTPIIDWATDPTAPLLVPKVGA